MLRDPARVLLFVVAMVAGASCVLPPDGAVQQATHYSPEVELNALHPPKPVTTLQDTCRFLVKADKVSDRDSPSVRVRWVADNKTSIVQLVSFEDEVPTGGLPNSVHVQILPDSFVAPLVSTPHALSLFVTDAPDWAISNEELLSQQATVTDYGQIKTSTMASVIEVRWFFNFTTAAVGCP
jgi:hypothetical protein